MRTLETSDLQEDEAQKREVLLWCLEHQKTCFVCLYSAMLNIAEMARWKDAFTLEFKSNKHINRQTQVHNKDSVIVFHWISTKDSSQKKIPSLTEYIYTK